MSDINRRALAAAISREREANRDWSKAAKEYRKRIAELEATLVDARREASFFRAKFRAEASTSAEFEAENQRLRDAAQAVVDSATPHYDRWVNGVTRICINRLKALLGGEG